MPAGYICASQLQDTAREVLFRYDEEEKKPRSIHRRRGFGLCSMGIWGVTLLRDLVFSATSPRRFRADPLRKIAFIGELSLRPLDTLHFGLLPPRAIRCGIGSNAIWMLWDIEFCILKTKAVVAGRLGECQLELELISHNAQHIRVDVRVMRYAQTKFE